MIKSPFTVGHRLFGPTEPPQNIPNAADRLEHLIKRETGINGILNNPEVTDARKLASAKQQLPVIKDEIAFLQLWMSQVGATPLEIVEAQTKKADPKTDEGVFRLLVDAQNVFAYLSSEDEMEFALPLTDKEQSVHAKLEGISGKGDMFDVLLETDDVFQSFLQEGFIFNKFDLFRIKKVRAAAINYRIALARLKREQKVEKAVG